MVEFPLKKTKKLDEHSFHDKGQKGQHQER